MSEYEAYFQLIMMIGIVFSMPFFYRVCFLLGKFITLHFFPPKYLTVQIVKSEGDVQLTKVKIDDNKALVEALLQATEKRSRQ